MFRCSDARCKYLQLLYFLDGLTPLYNPLDTDLFASFYHCSLISVLSGKYSYFLDFVLFCYHLIEISFSVSSLSLCVSSRQHIIRFCFLCIQPSCVFWGSESGIPPSSLVMDLQINKATGWDYFWALQLGTQFSKLWLPVVASPSLFSITTRFPAVKFYSFPLNSCGGKIGRRTAKKWPTTLGVLLSFPPGGTAGSGKTSWHRTVPAWRRDNLISISCSSYPFKVVFFGLHSTGGASASLLHSKFLSVVLSMNGC